MGTKQRLASGWLTALLILAVLWLGGQAVGMWWRVRQVKQETEHLEDRVAEVERDMERRRELLEKIQEEDWLTYQARLRLNYKLPDEQVVVVYKKEKADIISAVASASTQEGDRSWLFRLWDFIRGAVAGLPAEAP